MTPFVLLAVFFALVLNPTLLSALLPAFFNYDRQRIAEMVLLSLFNLYGALATRYRVEAVRRLQQMSGVTRLLLGLILGLGLVSSVMAPLPRFAFLETVLFVQLFFFALFIAATHTVHKATDTALCAIVIGAATYYSVIVFIALLTTRHLSPTPALPALPLPGFMNRHIFSEYQVWALPFLAIFPFGSYGTAAAGWLLALGCGSKATLLCVSLGLVFAATALHFPAKRWIFQQVSAFLAGGLLAGILLHRLYPALYLPSLRALYVAFQGDIKSRLLLWQKGLTLLYAHPWLGAGPLHFAYYPNPDAAHLHNSLLQIAAEWGAPAALAGLWLAVTGMRHWLKAGGLPAPTGPSLPPAPSLRSAIRLSLTASLVAGALQSLVSGVLVYPLSQVMMALVIGWAWGMTPSPAGRPGRQVTVPCVFSLVIGVLASVLLLGVFVVPMLPNLTEKEMAWYLQAAQPAHFAPRFWVQGWLR